MSAETDEAPTKPLRVVTPLSELERLAQLEVHAEYTRKRLDAGLAVQAQQSEQLGRVEKHVAILIDRSSAPAWFYKVASAALVVAVALVAVLVWHVTGAR